MSSRRLIIFALKFSRNPYFDNHLSEGNHTWTQSYLDHMYFVRLAFLSCHRTTGSMPWDWGCRVQIQYMFKCGISGLKFSRSSYLDRLIRKHSYLDQRYHIGLALIP